MKMTHTTDKANKAARKATGYILYEGPSHIDGMPIVVIATGGSKNSKTGGMVQTWIMRSDIEPHTALKTGQDSSVCGDCPHRPINGGACYVTVFQAPLSVYRAYKRGRYPIAERGQFAGLKVRIGSYGDPAAAPTSVWAAYVEGSTGHTGYTHQWRECGTEYARYCMASCDSESELDHARALGFRTFRIRLEDEPKAYGEAVCPASAEAGHKITCDSCKGCNGMSGNRQNLTGIVIVAHGSKGKVNAFAKQRAQ